MKSRWKVGLLGTTAMLALATWTGKSANAASPFADPCELSSTELSAQEYTMVSALSDNELSSLRGGFKFGDFTFDFSFSQSTAVNGEIVNQVTLDLNKIFSQNPVFSEDGPFGDDGVFDGKDVFGNPVNKDRHGKKTNDIASVSEGVAAAGSSTATSTSSGLDTLGNLGNDINKKVNTKVGEAIGKDVGGKLGSDVANAVGQSVSSDAITGAIDTKAQTNSAANNSKGGGSAPQPPISVANAINNTPIQVNVSDTVSPVSPQKVSAPQINLGSLVNIGSNSQVSIQDVPGLVGTVIQNSMDNAMIQQTNIMDIVVKGIQLENMRNIAPLLESQGVLGLTH
ncbi:MAG: hypothetical protein KDD76_06260 [Rickettsiales bacterium]|nr:hypothetical protein [Rickettsiales bacterium]